MTFTREEWLDQARALLPGCTEERRVEMYEDMMRAQAAADERLRDDELLSR